MLNSLKLMKIASSIWLILNGKKAIPAENVAMPAAKKEVTIHVPATNVVIRNRLRQYVVPHSKVWYP